MAVSSETKLNKQLTFSYKSFGSSAELASGSSPNDSKKHDPKSVYKLVETNEDCCSRDTPVYIYAVPIIFAFGVTIALVMQIYFEVSLVFIKSVVSDHERCTALAERVLRDRGSSVDAAITGALCLGVVHPHVSGVGGGGVMLIHDIQRNKTKVINFQGAAPKTFREEMLQNAPEVKAGLLVGVPGMLMGLHHAHGLYGRLSWEDVVSRAAGVAREGFNVSRSLAAAISKVKGEPLLKNFRNLFVPDGRALSPGSYVRMPGLAKVLEAGLWNFYHAKLMQEMEDEVQQNGGILSRQDISNYNVEIQEPLEGRYSDYIIQVPPPPSAGAALIMALNLLESFHLKENATESQMYRRIPESLTAALAVASGLGDPKYNSSVTKLLSVMLNKSQAGVLHQRITHSKAFHLNSTIPSHSTELLTGQVVVMGPDNLMVSVASSLNKPFGSRIITRSGIVLNSLVLDFFWPNKTRGQPHTDQLDGTRPGKRPLTFLMPTMVVPVWNKCGTYMALSSSGGQNRLSEITQMLVSVLFLHEDKNDTLSLRRFSGQFEPNRLLVDTKFPEEKMYVLLASCLVFQVKDSLCCLQVQKNKEPTKISP